MLIENLFMTHEIPDSVRQSAEFDFTPIWDTIQELQNRKQLFNPLAYIRPLVKGELLPAVVDRVLDARKELEKVLVQQPGNLDSRRRITRGGKALPRNWTRCSIRSLMMRLLGLHCGR
jgi:hypothetical protein